MRFLSRTLLLCLAVVATPTLRSEPALDRIGFGSCARQGEPQPIWKAVNAARPDVFAMIGDNIYADTIHMQVMQRKYSLLAAEKEFSRLRKRTTLMATWDDHDFGQNDAGADYPMKRDSQKLFMDFFQIPLDCPMRSREGVYNARIVGPQGKRVQLILLDTRYFRSPVIGADGSIPPKKPYKPNLDPSATILGNDQWVWLEEQLRQPAEVRLIFSSIQVLSEDHGGEKWMNFPLERERLFNLLKKTGAQGVVFCSGDRHFAELSAMDAGVGYPIYDLTSSGLNVGYTRGYRPAELNRHRVAVMSMGNNFGLIRLEWKPAPEIRLEIHDEKGDTRICQKVPLVWLSPQENPK